MGKGCQAPSRPVLQQAAVLILEPMTKAAGLWVRTGEQ
jgi:hypothetical protein